MLAFAQMPVRGLVENQPARLLRIARQAYHDRVQIVRAHEEAADALRPAVFERRKRRHRTVVFEQHHRHRPQPVRGHRHDGLQPVAKLLELDRPLARGGFTGRRENGELIDRYFGPCFIGGLDRIAKSERPRRDLPPAPARDHRSEPSDAGLMCGS